MNKLILKIFFTVLMPFVLFGNSIQAQVSPGMVAGGNWNGIRWEVVDSTLNIYKLTSGNIYAGGYLYHDSPPDDFPWYPYRNEIKTLIVEEGIERLGGSCFYNLSVLNTLILPKSLLFIVRKNFSFSTRLKIFPLPENVYYIEGFCISSQQIREIYYNTASLTYLGQNSFGGNNNVKKIHIGQNVTLLPDKSFCLLSNLEDVYIYTDIPPVLGDNCFPSSSNTTLHIPRGSLSNYTNSLSDTWTSRFTQILDDIDTITYSIVSAQVGMSLGNISPYGAVRVNAGGNYRYTFTAEPEYEIYKLIVDGVNVADSIPGGSYTFNNVSRDHYIYIKFRYASSVNNHLIENRDKLFIYPNYARDFVNISLTNNEIDYVVIYNALGQEVYREIYTGDGDMQIDVTSLNSGFYIVKVNGVESSKFIKY